MTHLPRPRGGARGGRAPALRAPSPARRRGGRSLAAVAAAAARGGDVLVALPARTGTAGARRPARHGARRTRWRSPTRSRSAPRVRNAWVADAGGRTTSWPRWRTDLRRDIPYPPGLERPLRLGSDRLAGPYDMASINHREEVQMLLEFRAALPVAALLAQRRAGGPGGGHDRARRRPEVAVPAARRRRLGMARDRRGGRAR